MIPLASRIATIVPTITGWCSVEKAQDLALAILKTKAAVSLEVGCWGGRSAIPMALAHKEQGSGVVIVVDPWSPVASAEGYEKVNADWWGSQNHELVYQTFLESLKKAEVEQFVQVIRAKSDDAPVPDVIDVLHLDGQHTDQTIRDVERFASRVRPGGYVFVDDIHWTGGGVERGVAKLLTMGFTQLFVRDTGAMFERTGKAEEPVNPVLKKNGRGRPPGAKNKKKVAKKARHGVSGV